MVKWHRPNLNPEDIAKIIQEGREENDKKFETYAEYVGYIARDNDKILNEYDHDHSKCEPNELTKKAMNESMKVLDALGSDYDENGIPYWEDPSLTQRGYNYKDQQIEGRDNV